MSLSLTLAALWGLAATATALLPMRYQIVPGLFLLVSAPVLIVMLGHEYGVLAAAAALAGFVSMFRRPLGYWARKYLSGAGGRERGE